MGVIFLAFKTFDVFTQFTHFLESRDGNEELNRRLLSENQRLRMVWGQPSLRMCMGNCPFWPLLPPWTGKCHTSTRHTRAWVEQRQEIELKKAKLQTTQKDQEDPQRPQNSKQWGDERSCGMMTWAGPTNTLCKPEPWGAEGKRRKPAGEERRVRQISREQQRAREAESGSWGGDVGHRWAWAQPPFPLFHAAGMEWQPHSTPVS